jgi:hypothetical protein
MRATRPAHLNRRDLITNITQLSRSKKPRRSSSRNFLQYTVTSVLFGPTTFPSTLLWTPSVYILPSKGEANFKLTSNTSPNYIPTHFKRGKASNSRPYASKYSRTCICSYFLPDGNYVFTALFPSYFNFATHLKYILSTYTLWFLSRIMFTRQEFILSFLCTYF